MRCDLLVFCIIVVVFGKLILIFLLVVISIFEINVVIKCYGSKLVVNVVFLSIFKGSIFGLLGLNGVGKIFFICMIIIIICLDEGYIMLDGEVLCVDYFCCIGYLFEEWGFYKKMKVGEYLVYLG